MSLGRGSYFLALGDEACNRSNSDSHEEIAFFFLHFSWSLFFCVDLQGNGKYLEL